MKFSPLARDEDPGSLFCIRDLVGGLHPNAPPPRKAGTNPRIATMAAHNSLQHITEFKAGRRMSMAGAPVQDATDWSCAMSAVASARDRDSFMRIYDHFMPRLCVYLRGLGTPPAVAEELAQESLLRLWQNAASYDPRRSAVSTWLFRIARNLFIDRARRLRYQAAQEETLRLFEVVPEPDTVPSKNPASVTVRPGAVRERLNAANDRSMKNLLAPDRSSTAP